MKTSSPTRRSLFGAAALAALPASAIAAGTIHPDAALLELCAKAHAATAYRREWDDKPYVRTETDAQEEAEIAECLRRCHLQDEALAAVIATPARTVDGCIAKAAVTAEILDYEVREQRAETFEAQASDHDRLALSLSHDLMRMGGGNVAVKRGVLTMHTPHGDRQPDADLIALCEQHSVNRDALNNGPKTMDDNEPEWLSYRASLESISSAQPRTLAGLVAKARAAKAEARNPDGTDSFDLFPVCDWTWDLANDLIRLAGSISS